MSQKLRQKTRTPHLPSQRKDPNAKYMPPSKATLAKSDTTLNKTPPKFTAPINHPTKAPAIRKIQTCHFSQQKDDSTTKAEKTRTPHHTIRKIQARNPITWKTHD